MITQPIELILKESIRINGKAGDRDTLFGDTTIQEKNITYPTDDKLYKKIIRKYRDIAEKKKHKITSELHTGTQEAEYCSAINRHRCQSSLCG